MRFSKDSNITDKSDTEDAEEGNRQISPIKKEQLKKQKVIALRKKLREGLPVLTVPEIRRFRLPYHEALLIELQENGYLNTAEFLKQLIDLQERMRKKFGPGTAVWLRPVLKDSEETLNLLVNSLITAETAHRAGNFAKECDELLTSAANFAFGPDDWWWVGEQLLYQCVSMEYKGDYRKQEAISYFLIGKYLVENSKKMEAGKYYLDLARDISKGKSWTCSKILKKKQDVVFIESCRLLYLSLIEEALAIMKTDPAKAAEICTLARKRAAEACDHENEYDALILKGKCELLLKQNPEGIATMNKALNRTVRRKNIKGICEAKIALALAYLQNKKSEECYECLKELKVLAEEYDFPLYLGQAYRFMGEYHLNQNQAYEATPLLMTAFYIFHENNDLRRREKVRTWTAISAGEELFSAFIRLIRSCDDAEKGPENIQKLIRWIDEKEFFWTQQTKFSFSFSTLKSYLCKE